MKNTDVKETAEAVIEAIYKYNPNEESFLPDSLDESPDIKGNTATFKMRRMHYSKSQIIFSSGRSSPVGQTIYTVKITAKYIPEK